MSPEGIGPRHRAPRRRVKCRWHFIALSVPVRGSARHRRAMRFVPGALAGRRAARLRPLAWHSARAVGPCEVRAVAKQLAVDSSQKSLPQRRHALSRRTLFFTTPSVATWALPLDQTPPGTDKPSIAVSGKTSSRAPQHIFGT